MTVGNINMYNCRLDHKHQVKVSDFGLTEDVYTFTYFHQDSNNDVKLPLKWMALESLQLGKFSEKSDVVSFFVVEVYSIVFNQSQLFPVVFWSDLLGNF